MNAREAALEISRRLVLDLSDDQIERAAQIIQAADTSRPTAPASADVEWAVSRWRSEVANRPMQNIHRRALDTTWRQVIRHFGGDDIELCGPAHDRLMESKS